MTPSNSPARQTFLLPTMVGALLLIQGCAAINEKLFGGEHEEITPFAQKTVEVLAVENILIHESELFHLRGYIDASAAVLGELQKEMKRVDAFRDAIVEYSIDLVRVTELYHSDRERVDAYAAHIEQAVSKMTYIRLEITDEEWEQIIAEIRSQDTLLDALRTFQPVVNRASRNFEKLISRIETDLVAAARSELDRRIEADFRDINDFLSRESDKRQQLIAAMIAIDQHRDGDARAIADLRLKQPRVGVMFPSDNPGAQQIDRLEAELHARIKRSTSLIADLRTDAERYRKVRSELDQKEAELRASLDIARVQITTWTLAHQALANGVKDPGEWMELSIKAANLVRDVF